MSSNSSVTDSTATTPIATDTWSPSPLPSRVWTTLITNTAYLSGLLTLDYSLKNVGTKYPLVALYTETFPPEGLSALRSRGIPHIQIPYLLPSIPKDYTNDPRFYDCWSKLTPFGLTQFTRVVQLDSDMLVRRNMDELLSDDELPLDPSSLGGTGPRVFAASHACVCNPLQKPHYPKNWVPDMCAFTSQHSQATLAQTQGASPTHGLGIPNGGLQVVVPSHETYSLILSVLRSSSSNIDSYDFADQSLLGDVFYGRWVALPYVYNALKTLRWVGVHDPIWRDDEVKCVHYILSPKPWDVIHMKEEEWDQREKVPNSWWIDVDEERRKKEKENMDLDDGF